MPPRPPAAAAWATCPKPGPDVRARLPGWIGLLALLVAAPWQALAAPLVVAVAQPPLFAPMQLAALEGHFAAEGLDVRIQPCINGRRCLQHLTDGEAQVATVADTPMMFSLHAGHRFDIVATFGASTRDTLMVVRTDRGIQAPADLAGKRVGVVRGTSAHYFASVFLLVSGVPRDAVRLVFLDPARGAEPLLRGEVDAAAFYLPTGPQALQQLGSRGRELTTLRAQSVMVNLVAQPGLSQDTLLRLLKAVQRSLTLMATQPARAHAVLAKAWQQDVRTVAEQLKAYEFRLTLDQNLLSSLEAQSRWAAREGLVEPAAPPPDYLDLMRTGPLQALDPRAMTLVK